MSPKIDSPDEVFFAVLERKSPEARAAYLDEVCGSDPELRRRVERLLDAQSKVGSFLESPALGSTVTFSPTRALEGPGTVIGPYKLLEQIGEGGMGVVYMADQTAPVRRKVALKIIKPGMDTKHVIARFEAERQALALMDHPNIAKVLDAGTTESGRPFFVMELVRGIPITEYCDHEHLSIPERLDLFVLVCRAVQHAHQKGIIHRDIKPSNVLITLHDGVPVPKVIDFGIAKATGQSLTDKTLYTGLMQLVGTPLYMSPEQAELSGLDVDTRSDIYSLGVLLYELLTGTTPFDRETFRTAALEEMRRIVREEEPPKPSTRLSALGDTLTTVSANRKSDPRQLNRVVRGELDWIVMRSLEKDRRRRYETANDFAADVVRYLTDRPVEACPPSVVYRVRKFARRNRRRLAAAAVFLSFGLIAAGTLGELHGQRVSRLNQVTADVNQALAGARTAIEARDLTLATQRVAEAQGRLRADRATLRELAAESDRVEAEIKARQADEARLKRFLELASRAQQQMGFTADVVGPEWTEEALAVYGVLNADDWLKRLEDTYLTADQKQQVRETAYSTLVSLADYSVRWSGGSEAAQQSADLLRRALAFHAPTRAFYFVRRQCYRQQGNIAEAEADLKRFKAAEAQTAWDYYLPGHTESWGGDRAEAIRSYEAALRIQPDHYPSLFFLSALLAGQKTNRLPEAIAYFTACIALRPGEVGAYLSRAECQEKLGRFDEAEADYSTAIAAATTESARAAAYQHRYQFYTGRGLTQKARNDLDQAFALRRQVLARSTVTRGPADPDTLKAMISLANAYQDSQQLDQAVLLREQILAIQKEKRGPYHRDTWEAMDELAGVYRSLGKPDQAVPLREQWFAAKKAKLGPDHHWTRNAAKMLAWAYAAAGMYDKEVSLLEPLVAEWKEKFGPDDPITLLGMHGLAHAYSRTGKLDQSLSLWEKTLARLKVVFGADNEYTINVMVDFAIALVLSGKLEDAKDLLRERLAIQPEENNAGMRNNTAEASALLSRILLMQERYAEAEPLAREALATYQELIPPSDARRFEAMYLLGGALCGQGQYAEAEPMLVKGYEGLTDRVTWPRVDQPFPKTSSQEAGEWLVRLYEAWGKPDEAAKWRREQLDATKATAKPSQTENKVKP